MNTKYIKVAVEVEAVQWNGNSNKSKTEAFVGMRLKTELESETAYLEGKGAPLFSLLIETKEGVMKAMPNDWIVKEPFPTGDRDFYPCKNEIFIQTYRKSEIPDPNAQLKADKVELLEALESIKPALRYFTEKLDEIESLIQKHKS